MCEYLKEYESSNGDDTIDIETLQTLQLGGVLEDLSKFGFDQQATDIRSALGGLASLVPESPNKIPGQMPTDLLTVVEGLVFSQVPESRSKVASDGFEVKVDV